MKDQVKIELVPLQPGELNEGRKKKKKKGYKSLELIVNKVIYAM